MVVLAIDPGHSGAFIVTDGVRNFRYWPMPVIAVGKDKSVSFAGVVEILRQVEEDFGTISVFLELAKPIAMGSKHAFNYGRDFGCLLIALEQAKVPLTLVEPSKWAKEMCDGVRTDLKPKARSLIAVKRLFPRLIGFLPKRPKKGDLMDGPVDALLIAGYGLRRLGLKPDDPGDFY